LNIYICTNSVLKNKEIEDTVNSSKTKISIFFENALKDDTKIDFGIIEYNENLIIPILRKLNKNNNKIHLLILENHIDNKIKDDISKYGTVYFFDINKSSEELKYFLLNYINNLENDRLNREVSGFLKYQKRIYTIPNSLKYLIPVTDHLTRDLVILGITDKDTILNIRFGIQEMIINAMEHGNLQISFDEKTKLLQEGINISTIIENKANQIENMKKRVGIKFILTDKKVTYIIKDQGKGFDAEKFMKKINNPANITLEHGRGILLTKNHFDEFFYNKEGNQVTLVIYKK